MIKYPEHFPEVTEAFSDTAISLMPPSKREKALRHIDRMRRVRRQYEERLKLISDEHEAGRCYCDDEYLCKQHSDEYHSTQRRTL